MNWKTKGTYHYSSAAQSEKAHFIAGMACGLFLAMMIFLAIAFFIVNPKPW